MAESKAWQWNKVEDKIWLIPAPEAYYYSNIWLEKGFTTFLDLGCGLGRHAIFFAKKGFDVYAMDLSKDAIERLSKESDTNNLNIKSYIGDVKNLPYMDNQFDCLLSYHVIYHADTDDMNNIVNEIFRIIKPGGEFLITMASQSSNEFKSQNNIVVDKNTRMKSEGQEKNIPHYYANHKNIYKLFSAFNIIKLVHLEEINHDISKCHYFIHGSKPF
jgi:ubiquinone/menaquinone biosynthesis C-methylase UbiE